MCLKLWLDCQNLWHCLQRAFKVLKISFVDKNKGKLEGKLSEEDNNNSDGKMYFMEGIHFQSQNQILKTMLKNKPKIWFKNKNLLQGKSRQHVLLAYSMLFHLRWCKTILRWQEIKFPKIKLYHKFKFKALIINSLATSMKVKAVWYNIKWKSLSHKFFRFQFSPLNS